MSVSRAAALLVLGCVAACKSSSVTEQSAQAPSVAPIVRQYKAGDVLRYVMNGVNRGRSSEVRYTAESEAIVKQAADGSFYEDTRWVRLEVGGRKIALDPASAAFRQELSLDPRHPSPMPDIRGVDHQLIGPIFDLMTFYVDLQLLLSKPDLVHAGDREYVPHRKPNSWADGTRVLVGQDCIDFDVELAELDAHAARVRVRHVPPPEAVLEMPVGWMKAPVGEGPNNWVQVEKDASTKPPTFVAGVGRESFDVNVYLERPSGRIVSATMDNPVDVVGMRCSDSALLDCTDRVHYRIHRRIELQARP